MFDDDNGNWGIDAPIDCCCCGNGDLDKRASRL
jgi:hypothetical protein